jgi:tRNA C32,U32 (ribose-2'-O)-methylase TrmJ
MSVYRVLADIVDAVRTSHLELQDLRRELKKDLAAVSQQVSKLGVEFEAFRHDTKITLDMLSELMDRTGRHDKDVATLKNRVGRLERHLKLKPLPDAGDQ